MMRQFKNWRKVHHAHHNSKIMDASFESNQSHTPNRFSRFSSKKLQEQPKAPLFAFPNRPQKEKDDSVSVQNSRAEEVQQSKSQIMKALSKPIQTFKRPKGPQQDKLMRVIKQVTAVNQQLRHTIDFFAWKFREIQKDWNRSFQELLVKQVAEYEQDIRNTATFINTQENNFKEVVQKLTSKQSPTAVQGQDLLVSFSGIRSNQHPPAALEKTHEDLLGTFSGVKVNQVEKKVQDSPIYQMPMSQVSARDGSAQQNVARNNVIASLLNTQPDDKGNRQLRNLRQTIQRMKEILQ